MLYTVLEHHFLSKDPGQIELRYFVIPLDFDTGRGSSRMTGLHVRVRPTGSRPQTVKTSLFTWKPSQIEKY